MFENRQPSQITLEIISVRLCILFVLMGLTACQASPTSSIPAASTVLPPTETQPAPFTTQPIAGGPVLLRADITLRKVMEVGANNIRIVRNPVDGDIYLLNPTEGIFRISDISGAASRDKVASVREIKGS